MGMWQGIYQGMMDVRQQKNVEADRALDERRIELAEATFNEQRRMSRLSLLEKLGAVRSGSSSKTSASAEKNAESVVKFKSRVKTALKDMSEESAARLMAYTEKLTQSPAKTAEVLKTLDSLNEKGNRVSIAEVPDIFQIVQFTESSGADTRQTLLDLYNLDLSDDEVFNNLLKTASTASPAEVVVDYDPTKFGVRKNEELEAQLSFIMPTVIAAARAAQKNPNDPDRENLTYQLDQLKSSDKAVKADAEQYLISRFFSPDQAQAMEDSGDPYFRGLTTNPLIRPYLQEAPTVPEAIVIEPPTKTWPTPTGAAINYLVANPNTRNTFDATYGPGSSDRYLQ